ATRPSSTGSAGAALSLTRCELTSGARYTGAVDKTRRLLTGHSSPLQDRPSIPSTVARRPSTGMGRTSLSADSHIRPLDQSRLGEEVAQMLRRAIISGELDSGTHLVESMLSDRFQVSRAPIREALRELESEGLVESRRRG